MDEVLKRDQNRITVLGGVTDDSDQDIRMLRVDPISKRLLVKGIISGIYTPPVETVPDASSITPDIAIAGQVNQENTQGAGTLTINAPTGTPVDGQHLIFRISTTASQTFSWNAIYDAVERSIVSLPAENLKEKVEPSDIEAWFTTRVPELPE